MKKTICSKTVFTAVKFNFLAKVTIKENLSTLRLENGKNTPLKAFEFLVIAVSESSEFKDSYIANVYRDLWGSHRFFQGFPTTYTIFNL